MKNRKSYEEMTKVEIIEQEKKRLNKICDGVDSNVKISLSGLIGEAAWMAANLCELRKKIDEVGFTEAYQNGENQKGVKRNSNVDVYNSFVKSYSSIVRQLTALVPKEKKEKLSEDDGFANFVTGRKN